MSHTETRNRIWLLLLPALLLAALSTFVALYRPASAEGDPARSAVGTDLVIEKGERVPGHVSVTAGNLTVRGEVLGDVIVVGGSADIEGAVTGNVYVVGGNVTLRSTASVGRDVDYAGGELRQEPGAKVVGAINRGQMPLVGIQNGVTGALPGTSGSIGSVGQIWSTPSERIGSLLLWGLVSFLTLAFSVALVAAAPFRVRIASATLEAEGGPSVIVGLVAAGLLGPLAVGLSLVLMLTLVGWVLIPVVAALAGLAVAAGLTVTGVWLGRRVYQTTHTGPPQKPVPLLVQMLLGMAALLCSTVVPAMLLPIGWIRGTLLGLLYLAGCMGLGSIILSKLGTLPPTRRRLRPASSGETLETRD